MNTWPTQPECRRFYGAPGTNQTILTLPYAMTYDGKPVTRMTINKKCADSAFRALTKIAAGYSVALGCIVYGWLSRTRRSLGLN